METQTIEEPRVWVGCLACYNGGRLTGAWVDALEAGEFVPCKRSDFGSPHEEWWVMDFENFGGFLTGECSPMEAQTIAEAIAEIPDHIPAAAAAAYFANIGESITDGLGDLEESYQGEWSSAEEYAQQLAEDIGAIPDGIGWPCDSIDWAGAARDLMHDYFTADDGGGSIYIFRAL